MRLYFAPWQVEGRALGLLEKKCSSLTRVAPRELANTVILLLRNIQIHFFLLFLIIRGEFSVIMTDNSAVFYLNGMF